MYTEKEIEDIFKNPVEFIKAMGVPEYGDKTSSYHHKWHDTPNPDNVKRGLRLAWFLDAQWSDCPQEVYEAVREMWKWWEYGNDHYAEFTSIATLMDSYLSYCEDDLIKHSQIAKHLLTIIRYIVAKAPDIDADDDVIIRFWW